MPEQIRYALLIRETLEVLREQDYLLQPKDVIELVRVRFQPTAHENETVQSGGRRWETVLGFLSGDAVTVGWMSKAGGKLGPDLICPISGARYRELGPDRLEEIAP